MINISIKAFISIFGGVDSNFISVLKKIKNNTKNRENITRGYNVFSYSLLKVISPFEDIRDNLKHGWNGYSIEIENQKIKTITKKMGVAGGIEANISGLFFDLLIEYVSEKMYERKIELF